jgi:seryl-tRNA synthetase
MSKKRCGDSNYISSKKQKIEQSEINEIRKMLAFLIKKMANDDDLVQTCVKKINQLDQNIKMLQIENRKYQMQISGIYDFANIPAQSPSYIS